MQQRENVLVIKKCQPVKDSSFVSLYHHKAETLAERDRLLKNLLVGLKIQEEPPKQGGCMMP